jgi:hypothetical protein
MRRVIMNKEPHPLRKQWEVADIFRLYGDIYSQSNPLPYEKIKVMHHIEMCRTAELGGHVTNADSSISLTTHAETGIAQNASPS